MLRLFRMVWEWFTAWPRAVRWWWPLPANLAERRRRGLEHAPADLVPTRFADASRADIELFNRGEGVALDVSVSVLTVVAGEPTRGHDGSVQNLGPHTHYLVGLQPAPPPRRAMPAGCWVRVGWRDAASGDQEREAWGLLDSNESLTFSLTAAPDD